MVARSVRDAEVVGSNPVASTIFVVRKGYNLEKAQDLVDFVLFLYYILCFVAFAKSLYLTTAFCLFFQKRGFEPLWFVK